jgi:diadenosine tetraphosphate (Ap4A) HIT family hydrolase
MSLICETTHYTVIAPAQPHVDRADGGHIIILPKERVVDRTQLSPERAVELMRLTMIAGQAMADALNARGIDVGRINYQDNGNWGVFRPEGPALHVHLYGRALSARRQPYGEALYLPKRETGFYEGVQPLDEGDVAAIRERMEEIATWDKYRSF